MTSVVPGCTSDELDNNTQSTVAKPRQLLVDRACPASGPIHRQSASDNCCVIVGDVQLEKRNLDLLLQCPTVPGSTLPRGDDLDNDHPSLRWEPSPPVQVTNSKRHPSKMRFGFDGTRSTEILLRKPETAGCLDFTRHLSGSGLAHAERAGLTSKLSRLKALWRGPRLPAHPPLTKPTTQAKYCSFGPCQGIACPCPSVSSRSISMLDCPKAPDGSNCEKSENSGNMNPACMILTYS